MKSQNILITFVAVLMFATLTQSAQAQCLADLNHDHVVDGSDLTAILSTWGTNGGSAGGDINGDGTVNGIDLASVLSGWGACPFQSWATVLEWAPNPTVVTDANLRAAIVASGLAWRVRDNSSNIEMLLVPAGTFTMGCSPSTEFVCYSNETPTHQVTLTNAFYMGRYEVTQAQWTATIGSNPSYFVPQNGYSSDTTKPVEQVSWNMIASGSTSFMSLTGLRLPTEAEWEYAYRAGTTTAYHSFPAQPTGFNDDSLLSNIAWFGSNSGAQTHAVGGKFANGLGLHDMSGNVFEWCQDWYGPYSSGSVTNPTGPATGTYRMWRGGDHWYSSEKCRASNRSWQWPISLGNNIGFRVARNPQSAAITAITPTSGPTAGGTAITITITGINLTGATSVTVGGVAATNVVVQSATRVTAFTPAGTVGAKSVAVTAPNETATAVNAFTYIAPPTISSVSPATGSEAGGTAITITGTSLTGATSVTVGGVAATNVVVQSATRVTAVTPAGTLGAVVSVAVTTMGGSASLASAFTYVVWYTVLEQSVDAAVVTNTTMRNAITASGLPWRVRDTFSNIEMLLVPAGTFTMGCSPSNQWGCYSDENPTHQVTLSAFYIGRYEVTQAQWTAKMVSNPSYFSGYSDSPSRPVERVSWDMIASGSASFMSLTGLRLPTEAEWEYAYRAGTTTAYHSYPAQPTGFNNDYLLGSIAWYSSNPGFQTHAVGGKFANGLGLHDMSCNVQEWCQDWYDSTYYASSPLTNPTGPATGWARLLRGGSMGYGSGSRIASGRTKHYPNYIDDNNGFRVVRNP